MRVLGLYFSQSGQSLQALRTFTESINNSDNSCQVREVDLSTTTQIDCAAPLPWSFLQFIRALPSSIHPVGSSTSDFAEDFRPNLVVIAYPVWFLSPVPHLPLQIQALPDGWLQGCPVVTIATCRNMWFEAQRIVCRALEAKGARVVAHATLEDRGSTLATFVTTPHFFLTGRRQFRNHWLARRFPEFGVSPASYLALGEFARDVDLSGHGQEHFRFKPQLALAEIVGRRIFRFLLLGWPIVRGIKPLESAYLLVAMFWVAVGIVTLMPPLAILSKLPPLSGVLARAQRLLTTSATHLGFDSTKQESLV